MCNAERALYQLETGQLIGSLLAQGTLPNGEKIAVKKLSTTSTQGDAEFKNELKTLTMVRHKNLVQLLGFCLAGNEKLLVYELLPDRSLDKFLFGTWVSSQRIQQRITFRCLYISIHHVDLTL